MQKKLKWISLVCVIALAAVCLVNAAVFAAGEVVNISTSQQLIDAINNQKEGQTWVLAEGTYDIADGCINNGYTINGKKALYFQLL